MVFYYILATQLKFKLFKNNILYKILDFYTNINYNNFRIIFGVNNVFEK